MLSKEAFNALLKIMEEPPSHVKFILATTEIHKVLPTVLSRCQRYDFRRITPEDIKERLLYFAEKENINLNDNAAELIARTADGGMRDALSLLDQCIAFSDIVTIETVSDAAGISGRDYLFDIIEAIANQNASAAILIIDKLYKMSKDMQKLCDELINQFRNIMMAKAIPENISIIACIPDEIERIQIIAKKLTIDEIFSKLGILQAANERLSKVSAKRVEIEMCIIKLCSETPVSDSVISGNSDLLVRINTLEKQLSGYSRTGQTPYLPLNFYDKTKSEASEAVPNLSKMKLEDFKPVKKWAEILEIFAELCPPAYGALDGSRAVENQGIMLIYAENEFFVQLLRKKENAEKLQEAVTRITGKSYSIRSKFAGGNNPYKSPVQSTEKIKSIIEKAAENNIQTECK